MPRHVVTGLATIALTMCAAIAGVLTTGADDSAAPRRDPAAWGSDHVGKEFPAYVTGDECLFCHRQIGTNWGDNRHQLTIRPAAPDDPAMTLLRESAGRQCADDVQYLLGSQKATRFLKRSDAYGKLTLLTTVYVPGEKATENQQGEPRAAALRQSDAPSWDAHAFGDRCAGCHTTAVSPQTRSFSALSLDCFVCHGDVPLDHTTDVSKALLSSKNRDPQHIVSICGQCHLRGGKSKSSGLPYANTFVAGDNLFRDFQVDMTDEAISKQSVADQHIWYSTRDVAVFGGQMNCLVCHDVHAQSSLKHQQLENSSICTSCHVPGTDNSQLRPELSPAARQRARSRVCEY